MIESILSREFTFLQLNRVLKKTESKRRFPLELNLRNLEKYWSRNHKLLGF